MITYTHQIKAYPVLTVERTPRLGWAVVGRIARGAKSFALVAVEAHTKGFTSREKARAALKEVQPRNGEKDD